MTLENGFLLNNRYRILDILGQGGMGAVYRAIDENLDVTVAVKENSFFSEEYARQFEREARILASLRHPNLPRVFDYFVIDQQGQYLVMDYIAGDDLRQWMTREETIPEGEALQIGIAICNALIYLHSRIPAIAHRDIKPGNVKITPSGEVVLVDFGLVKLMDGREMTTSAARAMTPGYSPPEQYGPDPTDHRSDVFSLGATLYAALTGYLPEDSLARATGKTTLTPLREYNPNISEETADAIEKALQLRFEDRWQTAHDFKDALMSALGALPADQRTSNRLSVITQTQPENMRVRRKIRNVPTWLRGFREMVIKPNGKIDPIWITIGSLFLALIIMIVYTLARPNGLGALFTRPKQIEFALTANAIGQQNTSTPGTAGTNETGETRQTPVPSGINDQTPMPTTTPNGGGVGVLAFVSDRSGLPQIWMIDIPTRQVTQLTDLTDGACQPEWSPDGQQIVLTSPCPKKRTRYPGSSLYILDLESGELTPLPTSLEGDFDPAWSPDGNWIAYTSLINGQMQLMKIRVDNFDTIIQLSDGVYDDSSPDWSDDGKKLVFVRTRSVGQIWLMDADGKNAVQFSLSGAIDDSNPVWYTHEDLILFSQALGLGSPSKQIFGMRLEDIGEAEEYVILPSAPSEYIPLMDNVDTSPDGNWLAFDYWYFDVLSDIYMMSFPGSNLTQLTDNPAMDYDPAWRPNP
jgi:eukaryotic-like serine/threonine-protein kinase